MFYPNCLEYKNTILKNQISVIRKTLQNKQAKELEKFRVAFNNAQQIKEFRNKLHEIMSKNNNDKPNYFKL